MLLSESVKIDKETMNRLRKIKQEEGISMTFIIRKAVEEYFKNHQKNSN